MTTTILAIIPDVYFTKIAVSKDADIIYQYEIDHSKEDFLLMDIIDQIPFRRDAIMKRLRYDTVDIKSIQYVVAEGGLLKPCESGVYEIDKAMIGDLIDGVGGNDIIKPDEEMRRISVGIYDTLSDVVKAFENNEI